MYQDYLWGIETVDAIGGDMGDFAGTKTTYEELKLI